MSVWSALIPSLAPTGKGQQEPFKAIPFIYLIS